MIRQLSAAFVLCILTAGMALAALGGSQGTPGSNLPALEALATAGSTGPGYTESGLQYGQPMAASAYQPPPAEQQGSAFRYDIQSSPPPSVYFQGAFVPWQRFVGSYLGQFPGLWVESSGGWSWYASLPLGAWTREILYLPSSGALNIYEIYPSGLIQSYSFGQAAAGYSYIWFYGDVPGRHMVFYTIDGTPSNTVRIDVTSYGPTSMYPSVPAYSASPALQPGAVGSSDSGYSFRVVTPSYTTGSGRTSRYSLNVG